MSGSVLRKTSIVGITTLLSRVTGLVRDTAYAHAFGAGSMMDAFLIAYKIPNFLRRLFAEGAFSQSFVPVISEYRVKRPDDVRELVSGVAGTLGALLLVITVLGVVIAPLIIFAFAPGFSQQQGKFDMAVEMLRWTFPYVFFISLTALFSGVLNSYGRFAVPAFTQVIMNVVMIVTTLWIAADAANPGLVLAIGVFVSGALQVLFQLPSVARLHLLAWPRWRPAMDGVRRIGRLMIPGIFGSSMAQVNLLLESVIASFLINGSIAWLYYADRIMEFQLGVFSIALATVILPALSSHHAAEDREKFSETLDWALRLVVVLVVPAAVALLTLAGPLAATIFGYGRMARMDDIHMTSYALMAYSTGLIGFSLVKVLAPGYFARQQTARPVRIGLIALAVGMAINVLVVLPSRYLGFPVPHVLLALSTCVSAAVNATLLWRGLAREGVWHKTAGWGRLLTQVLTASAVMAALLLWQAFPLDGWLALGVWPRVARLGACVVAGASLYFAVLWLMGMRVRQWRHSA